MHQLTNNSIKYLVINSHMPTQHDACDIVIIFIYETAFSYHTEQILLCYHPHSEYFEIWVQVTWLAACHQGMHIMYESILKYTSVPGNENARNPLSLQEKSLPPPLLKMIQYVLKIVPALI